MRPSTRHPSQLLFLDAALAASAPASSFAPPSVDERPHDRLSRPSRQPGRNGSAVAASAASLRRLPCGHQLFDLLLALVPRSVRIVVEGVNKLGTSIKALILSMPAGKVRAEVVPRKLHELQAVDRGRLTR